ncbi:MAG: hypothetical protein ACM31E_09950 [Fibrobacterota bacterium]
MIAKSSAAKTDWNTSTYRGEIGYDLTGNNNSGFGALPGGIRFEFGSFGFKGMLGVWWSSTMYGLRAWYYELDCSDRLNCYQHNGYSVRLVRD